MQVSTLVPVIGLAAYSGSGKTTLVKALVREFAAAGIRVGVIKHAHHDFDIDYPGKDSYEIRKAGARQTLVGSRRRWALVTELGGDTEPSLDDLLAQLDRDSLDLVLVEGFKYAAIDKLEIRRAGADARPLFAADPHIIALVTDDPEERDRAAARALPVLDLNRPSAVRQFICERVGLDPALGSVEPRAKP